MHFLKTVLTRPLREDGVDGAAACVELLEEYGLSRDDLFEVSQIASATASFTRAST